MENYPKRINLPLSVEMDAAIKARAARDGISAVAFIRQCVDRQINALPKIENLENRVAALEHALHAAEEEVDDYSPRGPTVQKKKGHGGQ